MIFSGCKIRYQFYSVDLSILYLIFLQKPCRNYCQDGKQVFLETGDTEGALQLRDHMQATSLWFPKVVPLSRGCWEKRTGGGTASSHLQVQQGKPSMKDAY